MSRLTVQAPSGLAGLDGRMLQWRVLNVFLCGPEAWRVMEAEHSLARSSTRESMYVHQGLRCTLKLNRFLSLSLSEFYDSSLLRRKRGENGPS